MLYFEILLLIMNHTTALYKFKEHVILLNNPEP